MLDINEFRKMQKENDLVNRLKKEIEKGIDSFLEKCAEENQDICVVFYNYKNNKCIELYYRYDDEKEPDEIITFSEDLESIIYTKNINSIFEELMVEYKKSGYDIECEKVPLLLEKALVFDLTDKN